MRVSSFAAGCVVLAVAASAFAAGERLTIKTGEDLVTVCSTDSASPYYIEASSFCHGFANGAYQFYAAWAAREPERQFLCFKEPYPARDALIREMVAWAKANPQYLKESGVDLMFRFLAQRVPCAK